MSADQIKRLRIKLKMTQGQFADRLGVSRRTAQGWEATANPHRPSRLAMKALLELKKKQAVL